MWTLLPSPQRAESGSSGSAFVRKEEEEELRRHWNPLWNIWPVMFEVCDEQLGGRISKDPEDMSNVMDDKWCRIDAREL